MTQWEKGYKENEILVMHERIETLNVYVLCKSYSWAKHTSLTDLTTVRMFDVVFCLMNELAKGNEGQKSHLYGVIRLGGYMCTKENISCCIILRKRPKSFIFYTVSTCWITALMNDLD